MAALDDVKTALDALQSAQSELEAPAAETLADKLLAAVVAVLEAEGWTAPAPAPEASQGEPITVTQG